MRGGQPAVAQGHSSERAAMIAAWRVVTAGLGAPKGGCLCALCGESPHPAAKKVTDFLPAHFPHPDLIDPVSQEVCAGCVLIFGGKPSKTAPPLRTRHVVALEGGEARLFATLKELDPFLSCPGEVRLLSWATSLKKHHLIHARLRTGGTLPIGSDSQCCQVRRCAMRWTIREARVAAERLQEEARGGGLLVLLGAKVCAAFGRGFDPFVVERDPGLGRTLVILPHPSGLCRLWNEPGAVERARATLREAGAL